MVLRPVLVGLLRPRVVEARCPRVERVVMALLEVGLVVEEIGAAMTVGGDEDLAPRVRLGHLRPGVARGLRPLRRSWSRTRPAAAPRRRSRRRGSVARTQRTARAGPAQRRSSRTTPRTPDRLRGR